jgi:hypothetical protein
MRVGEFKIKGIEPMGAVRMTTRGKYVKANAKRYLAYKERIYNAILEQLKGVYDPIDGAIRFILIFTCQSRHHGANKKRPRRESFVQPSRILIIW